MANKKKWKYNVSATFKNKEGTEHTLTTQLYQIGVYAIWDNDPKYQGNYTPAQMQKICRNIAKDPEFSDIKMGREIVVVEDENGFYIEEEA